VSAASAQFPDATPRRLYRLVEVVFRAMRRLVAPDSGSFRAERACFPIGSQDLTEVASHLTSREGSRFIRRADISARRGDRSRRSRASVAPPESSGYSAERIGINALVTLLGDEASGSGDGPTLLLAEATVPFDCAEFSARVR
jgi:hypothetical protein